MSPSETTPRNASSIEESKGIKRASLFRKSSESKKTSLELNKIKEPSEDRKKRLSDCRRLKIVSKGRGLGSIPESSVRRSVQNSFFYRGRSAFNKKLSEKGRSVFPRGHKRNIDKNRNYRLTKRVEIPPFERRRVDLELACVFCNKLIVDLFSAIVSPNGEGGACHFGCVIRHIREQENLVSGEFVLYIGAGNFAIAKVKRQRRGKMNFEIIRKIEFEPKKDENTFVEWRHALQQR